MSDPAELLALLTEHGIRLDHIPGGKPSLVALDIAGALGMMHDEPGAAMLLAKYAMDHRAALSYREHWQRTVDRHAYVEKWPYHPRQVLMAEYSMAEWLDAQRCRSCRGVGTQMAAHGQVSECQACEGTGLRKIGLRTPARALGMSVEGYRKSPWPTRMDWARGQLLRLERYAISELASHLTGRQ